MTLKTLMNAYRGWQEVEERRNREAFEVARWQAFVILSPNLKEKDRVKTSFPWEEKATDRPKLSPEQLQALSDKLDRAGEIPPEKLQKVTLADLQAVKTA